MKQIKDEAITSLWPLSETERLALSTKRIEHPDSKESTFYQFAYGYTEGKSPEPYRFLGECDPNGHPLNGEALPTNGQSTMTDNQPNGTPDTGNPPSGEPATPASPTPESGKPAPEVPLKQ